MLQWQSDFAHLDLLYQRLFCLIEVERRAHQTKELGDMATTLVIHLLAALQNGSPPAFAILHRMLTTCLAMTINS